MIFLLPKEEALIKTWFFSIIHAGEGLENTLY